MKSRVYFTHTSQSQGPGAVEGGCALGSAGSAGPHGPWVGRPLSLCSFFFFCWWPFGARVEDAFPGVCAWPPSAERVGVEAASLQGEGGSAEGSLRGSQTPGDRHKGLASGYNGGAVSHSAAAAGRQSSLCVRPAGRPCRLLTQRLLLPGCGLLSAPSPLAR